MEEKKVSRLDHNGLMCPVCVDIMSPLDGDQFMTVI